MLGDGPNDWLCGLRLATAFILPIVVALLSTRHLGGIPMVIVPFTDAMRRWSPVH